MLLSSALLASLSVLTTCVSGQLGNKYVWGADRMGKMVAKRQATVSAAVTASATGVADPTCTFGPRSRNCWVDGWSVATDFDQKFPTTGNTRTYNLEITNTTCSPDGNGQQPCYLINGQYPGPTIFADWGDYVSITVKNSMQDNGTGIHWHGLRQFNTPGSDGVGGITECPIAPGNSYTYTWHATQFGTSWYHSHYSAQYGLGVIGAIVINGPATSNYDVDLGTITVNDWYYADAWRVNLASSALLQQQQPPPNADALLVNGTGKSANGGSYATYTLTPGKKHLLRIINPSVDNGIWVKLDNHPFTVISADFIPINPIANQDWLLLGPGQRHEVVFTANSTGNYFFRAEVAGDCLSGNNGHGRAVFNYDGSAVADPADSNELPAGNGCSELVTVPYWDQSVDSATYDSQVQTLQADLTQAQYTTNGQNIVAWALNFTAMNVDWTQPTIQYLMSGNSTYPASYDVIEVPNEGVWTYWVIQALLTTVGPTEIALPPPPHPIHLHGHDFFVLGKGTGQYDKSSAGLNFQNPPRRDTTFLPGGGWLVVAFQANNPGTWLMHCHIAWHISQGLGVQFLEAKNQVVFPDQGAFDQQCDAYKKWQAGSPYPKIDSGL